MTISLIVNKIVSLLGTLNNPSFFLYRVYHYLNKDVPYGVTKYIYKKNLKDYQKNNSNDFFIETYDGSGQAVHPDIAYMKNSYWMVLTPYPYGMEEYENPCIYHGSSLSKLQVPKAPIAVQHKHIQGVHLSDPCFATDGEQLYCYYRESERKGEIEKNTIWGMWYNEQDKTWVKPDFIMDSVDDKLLSPAMVYKEPGDLTIYYVSSLNGSYSLVSTKSRETSSDITAHKIFGMPEDYELWHIGISKAKDINPNAADSIELFGLFLSRAKGKKDDMRLFEARNNGLNVEWHIIKEIEMPDDIKDIVAFPYKSCYIPQEKGKILLSFRDKKSRNRLMIV